MSSSMRRLLVCRHRLAASSSYLLSILLFIQLVSANSNHSDNSISGHPFESNSEIRSQEAASSSIQLAEVESRNNVPGTANQIETTHQIGGTVRSRRTPIPALLVPINELRVSGSKSEPPSRPSADWSKQRPYFGLDVQRNISIELGKTAYLTCKVFELGDKTVSWLRPRENEILTAGKYTYIGDPRFAPINENGSHDWILEIKDVGLNDSTSYECQVSTDPKMSLIINLQVKAAKSRIRQGDQFYAPLGSNVEFTCEIGQRYGSAYTTTMPPASVQQTYWYHNGNLLNYARTHLLEKNFSIEWDQVSETSRFKLYNLQLSDMGNYTCKPTSAEPSVIRLHVRRANKNGAKDRIHQANGYLAANTKEAQRNRQQYYSDLSGQGHELNDHSGSESTIYKPPTNLTIATLASCLLTLWLLFGQDRS